MNQGYTFVIGISLTAILFVLRELNVIKNRWLLLGILLIAVGMLNFSIWQYPPALWVWFAGSASAILSVLLLLKSFETAFPQISSLHLGKSVAIWFNRIMFTLAVTSMLLAMIWDTARPTFPMIAWRAIASLWFLSAFILYINYVRGQARNTTQKAKSKEESHSQSGKTSDDQVSEHVVKHIETVTEQFQRVIFGAYSGSIKRALDDVRNDNNFRMWREENALATQLIEMFGQHIQHLTDGVIKYRDKTKSFGVEDIPNIYNEITTLNIEYRSAVGNFIHLLDNLEKQGCPDVWTTNEQLSDKIWPELRDNYDKLMQRIENLKVYASVATKSLLPDDEHLTKFDRINGVSG